MTSMTDAAHPDPAPSPGPPQVGGPSFIGPERPPVHGALKPDLFTRLADRVTAWPVWVAPVAALVCMTGAVGYTLAVDPTASGAGDPPTCLLKYTTGFDCPGCGGTRAAWYLLHGDLPAAARHHALFVFAVPFLLWMYAAWAGKRVFGWRLPQLTLGPTALGVFLGVWGLFSVLRNLPWAPFTWFFV